MGINKANYIKAKPARWNRRVFIVKAKTIDADGDDVDQALCMPSRYLSLNF